MCFVKQCPQEGRVAPDNSIGRVLAETVSSLPKISPAAFDKLVNDSLQVSISYPFDSSGACPLFIMCLSLCIYESYILFPVFCIGIW